MIVIRIFDISYKNSIDYCQCFFDIIKMFYQNNSGENVSNGKHYKID